VLNDIYDSFLCYEATQQKGSFAFSFYLYPGWTSSGRGSVLIMEIDAYIAHCKQRLAQIEGIFQQMEDDEISKDSPAWSVLEEKYMFWRARLEACGQVDPGQRYQIGEDYFWN